MGRKRYTQSTLPTSDLFRLLQWSARAHMGPLEQKVLTVLWQRGSATVREVMDHGEVERAYTTVMTTLDRMHTKQLVERVMAPGSRAFRYVPRLTQAEWERAVAVETIRQVLGLSSAKSGPLSYLVEAITQHDAGLLDELQRLVDEKRGELRSKSEAGLPKA
jgi:predicted transcriptional regulator